MPEAAILNVGESGPVEPMRVRIGAAAVSLVCLALLVTAWRLQPSSAGHGTHTQLGMPPCGFAMMFNKPCMTCGMTTAFAHAAHGQLWEGFKSQPMGLLLAVASAGVFWLAGYVAVTGSRLGRLTLEQFRGRNLIILLVLSLAAWGYKISTWSGI